jgi:hypothetical protein
MSIADLKKLCTPALVYLIISFIAIFIMLLQNFGSRNVYCLGGFSCNVENVTTIFIIKILYVLFWTWVLSLMCGAGYKNIAWLIILFPFILFFILIALMISGIAN